MTKSTYEKQAEDFLHKHETTINIKFLDKDTYFDGDKEERNIYYVTLRRRMTNTGPFEKMSFKFGDSIHNTRNAKKPTAYSVLACLQKYEVSEDLWDFAAEFGYEITNKKEYRKVEKTHRAVLEEYENVKRLFGDCLEELSEIA